MKKLFLSSDMEGTTGICAWQETNSNNEYSNYFLTQMTKEVAAACKGAVNAGYDKIIVKDAHDYARNIFPNMLPKEANVIRGWMSSPYSMMGGLDETFNAVGFTGYHSGAGTNGSPLSHTMNLKIMKMSINGIVGSEFVMNAFTAAYFGVPIVFLAGDKALCETAKALIPQIKTVATQEGYGNSTLALHPDVSVKMIEEKMGEALLANVSECKLPLPEKFEVYVEFVNHFKAQIASFYPGTKRVNDTTAYFEANNYLDVLKFFMFTL